MLEAEAAWGTHQVVKHLGFARFKVTLNRKSLIKLIVWELQFGLGNNVGTKSLSFEFWQCARQVGAHKLAKNFAMFCGPQTS